MWREGKLLYIVAGNAKWYSCYENQYGGCSIKNRTTVSFSNPNSKYLSKRTVISISEILALTCSLQHY